MAPPSVASTSELQRFDNAERVPRDITRNGFEHALRSANLDDELYRCRRIIISFTRLMRLILLDSYTSLQGFDSDSIEKIIASE